VRVYSKVKRQKGTLKDPYRVAPIPPKSVVRAAKGKNKGQVFRIGYYGKRDGLDCIWLVNDEGEYQETAEHAWLFANFDIIVISDETDLYGKHRPILPPIRKAVSGRKKKSR